MNKHGLMRAFCALLLIITIVAVATLRWPRHEQQSLRVVTGKGDTTRDSMQQNSSDQIPRELEDGDMTWHERNGVIASDCFDDQGVIALCKAVERDDLGDIDRLVLEGVDVNSQGHEGWTPLFWSVLGDAPADRKSFARLLEHGADPNRPLKAHSNKWFFYFGLRDGDSVTSLAAGSPNPALLNTVLAYGGDPNYLNPDLRRTPIFLAVRERLPKNVERLLDAGADVDHVTIDGVTPLAVALERSDYDMALLLLKADADWRTADCNGYRTEFDVVTCIDSGRCNHMNSFHEVVDFLKSDGFDLERAREDYRRFYE